MTREILFRGKRTDNGEWIQGGYCVIPHPPVCFKEDLEHVGSDKHCIVCENPNTLADWGMPRQMCMAEVDLETIGQYTGLKDKNGTKIFEGDIVHCVAQYDSGNLFVVFEEGEFRLIDCSDFKTYVTGMGFRSIRCFNKTIIGTIYDNPELLPVKPEGGAE